MAQRELVRRLMKVAGTSYARQAGIRLGDTPTPLYEVLVLAQLLSARIAGSIAVAAARELFGAGLTNPRKMLDASWQARVNALGRARYRRYDESTATRLGAGAQLLLDQYGGDLRMLAERAGRDLDKAGELLREFPGIGPLGAAIFLREVQAVWSWVQPYLDERVASVAAEYGLPHTARGLASAVGSADLSRISAALMRVSADPELRRRVLQTEP